MELYNEVGNVIYTFDELLNELNTYINDEYQKELIKRAYLIAKKMHIGQKRKSGEDYIIHPLNVAFIASTYKLDYETICAALLHDVVEDTSMTIEEITELFGPTIATLVDGVTKITNMTFSTKDAELKANQNKILRSMCQDVRIIFIKLADRLHNMRTLSSVPAKKQILKANETYELYVPLAYRYGLYRIKEELEDICFYYRKRDEYLKTTEILMNKQEYFHSILTEMKEKIRERSKQTHINPIIEESIKNVHGVYRRFKMNLSLENMHDLLALKIIVPELQDCYLSLGVVHSLYNHIDSKFKDYIFSPKENNYKSIHTSLFSGNDYLVQARIRTNEMNVYANAGIMAYFQNKSKYDVDELTEKLKHEFSCFYELVEASNLDEDLDLGNLISEEFEEKKVTIHTVDGEKLQLPYGSTLIDASYKLGCGCNFDFILVNNRPAQLKYQFSDGDIIKIVKNEGVEPQNKFLRQALHNAKTANAKNQLKLLIKNKSK